MGSSSSSSSSSQSLFFITTTFFLLLLSSALSLSPTPPGPVNALPIAPNFTASHLRFTATSGAFLSSPNNSFQARLTPAKPDSNSFYFVVIHVPSNTVVWSANRNAAVSESSQLRLTQSGLALQNDSGRPIWSTPPPPSAVASMQLFESGNLVLLDAANATVWESFDYPTDLLVSGQRLPVGQSLVSSLTGDDFSEGSYRLTIGANDAVLQWNGMNYWKLSMGNNAFRDTSFPVEYMVMNYTGVYLMAENGQEIVVRVILHVSNDTLSASANSSNFRVAKLKHDGSFAVVSYGSSEPEFTGPADRCQIPFICRRLDVCSGGGSCQCAPAFRPDPKINSGGDCVPSDGSLALPSSSTCHSGSPSSAVTYLSLRNDLDYFSNDFTDPVMHNVNLSACEALCSSNCSCLGVFYSRGSGSCYVIRNFLGSLLIKTSSSDRVGYIKAMTVVGIADGYLENKDSGISVLTVVLLPSSGVILIALIAALIICARRRRIRWKILKNSKSGQDGSCASADEEMDFELIPGLPVRFDYKELAEATRGFGTLIGSGGFGTVYKGTLKDGTTEVAVKKITCLGSQGRREFLTEIAVIGKTHHVNLVRLKGFCTHGQQRFLVYEYIKRGSLDRTLFSGESVLNWQERHEIALGTARGLAYLHSGCEHKILHCDIKPENILLHEKSQVKISDFGLSKLLSPEQSGLFTTLRGTRGYLAPEWLTSASISDRTDVYSYGMVLLEIIRGQKNSHPQEHNINRGTVSSSRPQLVYFPLLALEMHEERRYQELVDPRLMGRVTSEQAEKLVRVALCCVQEDPGLRPSMTNVVGMLEGGVPLGEPRMESLSFLRFYGRRFTEASTLGDNSEGDELMMMYRQAMTTSNTNGSSSESNSLSYMPSQEVSGPR